jgi:hypothetical protein
MKSACRLLHHVVEFINAVCAIHVGLLALGYNALEMGLFMQFAKPIEYIFGISGVIGIIMVIMHATLCGCHSCDTNVHPHNPMR